MKRITLIKVGPASYIAHLYEHLFYMALVNLFSKHNCASRLDYYIRARTYEPGLIHVDIDLYTPKAAHLTDEIENTKITVDENAISVALVQLMAEDQTNFRGTTHPAQILTALDGQPWLALNAIANISLREQTEEHEILHPDSTIPTRTLNCRLYAADLPENILPLFEVSAQIIAANIENKLTDTYGYYAYDEQSQYKTTSSHITLLRIPHSHKPSLTEVAATCSEVLNWLPSIDFVPRFREVLSQPKTYTPPDELTVYNATHMLVGSAGWQELATDENIHSILQHIKLELGQGGKKISITYQG